ncbi:MAG: energy transducer TonB [Acidobacteria bacterium]|nr:energy transducer TonB [Acidobacteriota bacterium]
MFEDSMFESRTATQSATRRWTMAGSSALQIAIAATLVVIPLLHPEKLAFHVDTPLVFTPPPPRPPLPVATQQQVATDASSATLPVTSRPLPPIIDRTPGSSSEDAPVIGAIHMGVGDGLPIALATSANHGPAVTVAPAQRPAQRVRVSNGVTAGVLLAPIRPAYPAIARAAGISGAVVIEAIISKTGAIESLHVISGPPMLREAALDAIRSARYRPYLLNGEPTEIQTTFTVNFKIGG